MEGCDAGGPGGGTVHHVYPAYGPDASTDHVVSGAAGVGGLCWCGPQLFRLCQQCEPPGSGCWQCDGGWVRVESLAPGDDGLVVHNDVPKGE